MSKHKEVFSWKENWSGRGIAMIDRMENSDKSANRIYVTSNVPTFKTKLATLRQRFPYDRFYKSIEQHFRSRPLTPKQIQAIDKCFNSLMNKTNYQQSA